MSDYDDDRQAERDADELEFLAEERRRARAGRTVEFQDIDTIVVVVDVPITSPLNGSHCSHAAVSGRRNRERRATLDELEEYETPEGWDRYYVLLERVGANRMDDDNLQAGFKTLRDATASYLGLDDADPRIVWRYAQRVERQRDMRFHARSRAFRSWARIVISPRPELPAGVEVADPPDHDERPIQGSTRRARPSPPQPIGGPLLRQLELPPRSPTSRLVAQLRRLEKPSGRGRNLPAGSLYLLLSLHFEQSGEPWRSAGTVIYLSEAAAVLAALTELCAAAESED